jgi:hypothetical protein
LQLLDVAVTAMIIRDSLRSRVWMQQQHSI